MEENSTILVQIARLSPSDQLPVAEILLEGRVVTVRESKLVLTRRRLLASSVPRCGAEQDCQLLCGDIKQLGERLADNSVDLIVTDPPYATNNVGLFDDLGDLARRVLKPGGSMFCMAAAYHLPAIIAALSARLNYQWLIPFLLAGNGALVHARRVVSSHKPILWFVKGRYVGPQFGDVIVGVGKDKRFHHWGQSESGFDLLIERYSKLGDLILDPFVGGGTTAAIAIRNRRRFIGFDIDPDAIRISQLRISQLPRESHSQAGMATEARQL